MRWNFHSFIFQSIIFIFLIFKFYFVDGKICYRLQVLKDGLDGNYDWLSFETEEEEKEFGRGGTVVECIFDFV